MSPRAGFVLMQEIEPRLRHIIPRSVQPVGAEDAEELIQDALAVAARMMHDLEQRNKSVTPGNIAYYTLLHMKSGKRSYGAGRTDVMSAGGQLDGNSSVLSFEEAAGHDPDTGEEIPLGEMLAGEADDPSMTGARNLDWEEFLDTHDSRYGVIAGDLATGRTMRDAAKATNLNYSTAVALKYRMAGELEEFMGASAIADSLHVPAWHGNIMADREKAACKADRRRA